MPKTYYRGLATPTFLWCNKCQKDIKLTPSQALDRNYCQFCGGGLSPIVKRRRTNSGPSVKIPKLKDYQTDIIHRMWMEWCRKSNKYSLPKKRAQKIASTVLQVEKLSVSCYENIGNLIKSHPKLLNTWIVKKNHVYLISAFTK